MDSFLILLCLAFATCSDLIVRRKGGIIRVNPQCSRSKSEVSVVSVFADFPVFVEVFCRHGYVARPVSEDQVEYSQRVAFSSSTGESCLFLKKVKSSVYTVKVKVSWESRNPDVAISQAREYFLVTCSYDEKAESESSPDRIDVNKHVFDEVIHNMGPAMQETQINLTVVDVVGSPVDGSRIPLGRIIRLKATVSGRELVRPVNCIASSGSQKYRILLGGCGDGLVFNKGVGFKILGNVILSPYFVAFRLDGQTSMVFKCNFTACYDANTCDGSSCYKQNEQLRKRRSSNTLEFVSVTGEIETSNEEMGSSKMVAFNRPVNLAGRQLRALCDTNPFHVKCRNKRRTVFK